MPTRFWLRFHVTPLQAYRWSGMLLKRHLQYSHISCRQKTCRQDEFAQLTCSSFRISEKPRGERLPWVEEHERLTSKYLPDFQCYAKKTDEGIPVHRMERSAVERKNVSVTIRQWAHQKIQP